MEITERKEANVPIIVMKGRLDAASSGDLSERLSAAIEAGAHAMIIDFAELDYISSSGLRVMLMALKKLGATGGRLVLCSLKDHVREVFDIAGFAPLFPMFASAQEAIEALRKKE